MRAAGKKHNAPSEMRWAQWQTPPVICCVCGERVTLKEGHRGYFDATTGEGRTWHLRCDPFSVSVTVEVAA